MKQAIIGFVILFIISLSVLPPVAAQDINLIPQPGTNCGIANDPTKEVCCFANIQNLKFDKSLLAPLSNIPTIGPAIAAPLSGLLDALNFLVDSLPIPIFGNLPILPSFGKLKQSFANIPACIKGSPNMSPSDQNCKCVGAAEPPLYNMLKYCDNINSPGEKSACKNCFSNLAAGTGGIWTQVGCVNTSAAGFVKDFVFSWGIGLAGIMALLCIIYAAITLQTSQGNPEKIKRAQELLTSCIMGLMLIIFSIFILRLIGVNILKIPGFS